MEKVAKLPLVIATYLVEEGNNVETDKRQVKTINKD